jgi:hypothetical protein
MRKAVGLLTIVCIAACSTEPSNHIAGTYALRFTGGHSLPWKWLDSPVEQTVTVRGSFILRSDNRYLMTIEDSDFVCGACLNPPAPQDRISIAVDSWGGAWTVHGETLTLTDTLSLRSAGQATIRGDTIFLVANVYVRQ